MGLRINYSMSNSSLKGKKVIVTGAEGFMGRALTERLKIEGAKVIPLDLALGSDITDLDKTVKLLKVYRKIDVVYHLAAVSFVPYSWENPQKTLDVNLRGTLNMLEICRIKKTDRFVLVSSYVYGRPDYLPIDEKHPVRPANPYSWSKYLSEGLCRTYSASFGINCVILRPFNIIGPGQKGGFLLPQIIEQAKKKGSIKLNDPRPKRDFLFISDMVEALIKAGMFMNNGCEIFNIGYGKSYSVREIIKIVQEVSGKKFMSSYRGVKRKGEILDVSADIRKAKKVLKWIPKTSIKESIRKIWEGPLDED